MRVVARAWLVLCGLVTLALCVLAPFYVRSWHEFSLAARAIGGVTACGAPALRYLRKNSQEISGPE